MFVQKSISLRDGTLFWLELTQLFNICENNIIVIVKTINHLRLFIVCANNLIKSSHNIDTH